MRWCSELSLVKAYAEVQMDSDSRSWAFGGRRHGFQEIFGMERPMTLGFRRISSGGGIPRCRAGGENFAVLPIGACLSARPSVPWQMAFWGCDRIRGTRREPESGSTVRVVWSSEGRVFNLREGQLPRRRWLPAAVPGTLGEEDPTWAAAFDPVCRVVAGLSTTMPNHCEDRGGFWCRLSRSRDLFAERWR